MFLSELYYYYYYYYYCFWIPPLISLQSNPPPQNRFTRVSQCIIWGGEQKGLLHSISHCRRVTFPFSALQHSLPNEGKNVQIAPLLLTKGEEINIEE